MSNKSRKNDNSTAKVDETKKVEETKVEGTNDATTENTAETTAKTEETTDTPETTEVQSEDTNSTESTEETASVETEEKTDIAPAIEAQGDKVEISGKPIDHLLNNGELKTEKVEGNADLLLHVNPTINNLAIGLLNAFADREATNLPKYTEAEVTAMAKDKGTVKVSFDWLNADKTKGRITLSEGETDKLTLPLKEGAGFNFSIDYAGIAAAKTKEAEKLAEAKEEREAEAAQKEAAKLAEITNKKLHIIAESTEKIFEERAQTNLPRYTETEIRKFTDHEKKGVDMRFFYSNADKTKGYMEIQEFNQVIRIPAEGEFEFGIDYDAVAKERAKAALK